MFSCPNPQTRTLRAALSTVVSCARLVTAQFFNPGVKIPVLSVESSTMETASAKNEEIAALEDVERINVLYAAVLDHLLIPPSKKDELLQTQTLDKKKQMLKMHQQILEPGANSWGDKEAGLLNNIVKAKIPDLQSLARLRIILTTANREFMVSFLEHGGVSVLLRTIESRVSKSPLRELDVAILYEILTCCKAVMNNRVGMDGFIAVQGSIATIARCLHFEFKTLALLVRLLPKNTSNLSINPSLTPYSFLLFIAGT